MLDIGIIYANKQVIYNSNYQYIVKNGHICAEIFQNHKLGLRKKIYFSHVWEQHLCTLDNTSIETMDLTIKLYIIITKLRVTKWEIIHKN